MEVAFPGPRFCGGESDPEGVFSWVSVGTAPPRSSFGVLEVLS